jgi:hypothetical protein
VHQPFELHWQQDNGRLDEGSDAEFAEHWRAVREFIDPQGIVIDIGCGPRPPFAPCIVIEPLAQAYIELAPARWWNNVLVHAHPAEQRVLGLSADTVICWNCLDHSIGWRDILENIWCYARPQARVAIATDFYPPFVGHPGFERAEFMHAIEERFSILESRENWRHAIALLLRRK